MKVGDKINCDDKGTCTKKMLQMDFPSMGEDFTQDG